MQKNLNIFIEPGDFSFKNTKCTCVFNTVFTEPNKKPEITLQACPLSHSSVQYEYKSGLGLIRKAEEGSKRETNIIAHLISLDCENLNSIADFFESNGFLFPLSSTNEYTKLDISELTSIINHVKATVNLISSLGGKMDYEEMFNCAAYLAFSTPSYESFCNPQLSEFQKMMEDSEGIPDIDRSKESFGKDYYETHDSIGNFKISIEDYNAIRSGDGLCTLGGSTTQQFTRLFNLYFNKKNCSYETRKIIDFFFRIQIKNHIFKINANAKVEFLGENCDINSLSLEMKQLLIDISQSLIETQINANIKDIHPIYRFDNSSPQWAIPSLLQAVYFSLFFMKPGIQVYKRCANPRCKNGGYFLCNTASLKKKYCCDNCRDAANQALLRAARKRELSN